MRICIFTDSFLPYISGVTTAVATQARGLADKGHEVIIFCPKVDPKTAREFHQKIKVYEAAISFPAPRYKGLTVAVPSVVKTSKILKKFMPDIIHVHTEFGTGWEGLICSKIFNIPIIGNFHTFFAEPSYLKSVSVPDLELIKKAAWSYSISFLNQCDYIISPSKTTQAELIGHGLKKKSLVISNGLPMPKLRPEQEITGMKKKYCLKSEANLIYVGRIALEKSLDIVIDAFRIILISMPNVRFFMVGGGNYFKETKQLVRKYGLDGKIIMTGPIPHDRLIEENILLLGDVFITASKTENQPVSVMEAMAFGLPVIGVNKRGVPELVQDGRSGFVCEADDPISIAEKAHLLLQDTKLREKMSKNAQQDMKKHEISVVISLLEKIYLKAISENSRKKAIKKKKKASLTSRVREKLRQLEEKIKS